MQLHEVNIWTKIIKFLFRNSILAANSTSEELCVSSGLQKYVGVFALSNVIFGVGGATLYTVGTAYIDDSVDSVASPLYMGM